jgi:hypothetical protein
MSPSLPVAFRHPWRAKSGTRITSYRLFFPRNERTAGLGFAATMTDEKAGWTDQDDTDVEYGALNSYDSKSFIAEQKELYPPRRDSDIWPNWSDGRPTAFRRTVRGNSFSSGSVYHRPVDYSLSLDLRWQPSQSLGRLKENYRLLPGTYSSEWSGVYWNHWRKEDRLVLLNAAEEALKGFNITLNKGELKRLIENSVTENDSTNNA